MPEPRYKRLVDRLAEDIRSGRLRPGVRMPTHRDLAAREGIALVTATRVYAELEVMGLVSGEIGRGTFVKEPLPREHGVNLQVWNGETTDLSFNNPSLPDQTELFRTALRQLALSGDLEALLRYQPHGGREHERAIVAHHLRSRGLEASPATVVLTSGGQHGLSTSTMSLLEPGDVVAVDALTYPGFKLAAELGRLELAPIPAAGNGLDPDALAALCKRRRVRAVYTMPTLHNPLGWVLSATRRRELIAVARRHGLIIIEDAAYAFLADRSPPPLASLAPETTVYVSSFSKSIATGLRVGFIHAPAEWIGKLERKIRATTWNTPAAMTAIACGWIEDGTVDMLEAGKRSDAALRQQLAARVLHRMRRVGHPSSYFLWLPLEQEVRADAIAMALMRERITVSTAHPYATSSHVPHALRLALASVDMPTLQRSLEIVARIVADHTY
jgi:DNA-binding transcriptional MocR family regulator